MIELTVMSFYKKGNIFTLITEYLLNKNNN